MACPTLLVGESHAVKLYLAVDGYHMVAVRELKPGGRSGPLARS